MKNPFTKTPAALSDAALDRAAARPRAQLADILIKAARALAAVEKAEAAQDAARSQLEGPDENVEAKTLRLEGKALGAVGKLADALALDPSRGTGSPRRGAKRGQHVEGRFGISIRLDGPRSVG
jgi:hypothetical protein